MRRAAATTHVAAAACALLAVAACAWFVVGIRQAQEIQRASAILSRASTVTPAEARTVSSLLSSAAFLDPDREVNLLRGQLALERGRPSRAQQIIEHVTRAEPQNLAAWLALAQAATNDVGLFDYALRRIRALEPVVPAH